MLLLLLIVCFYYHSQSRYLSCVTNMVVAFQLVLVSRRLCDTDIVVVHLQKVSVSVMLHRYDFSFDENIGVGYAPLM